MTVGRSHAFTLDDATLSGGAVIAAAGSGLPRRITGGIDFEAMVMALGPSGYWRLNEASGDFLDRSANARPITPATSSGRSATGGHGKGGCVSGYNTSNATYSRAAAEYPEHRLVAGTPFAAMTIFRIKSEMAAYGGNYPMWPFGTKSVFGLSSTRGYSLGFYAGTLRWFIGNGSTYSAAQCQIGNTAGFAKGSPASGEWFAAGVRYSGGPITDSGSWRFFIRDTWYSATYADFIDPAGAGSAAFAVSRQEVQDYIQSDTAVWTGGVTVPTEAQLTTFWHVACGRALWTLPTAAYSRTLKGFQLPGVLCRVKSATETRLGVRCYYSINGAAEVEFDPGDDLSATIPASQSCTIAADLSHYHIDDLPWIADASGGGPVALYDEADPVTTVNVTAIHSHPTAIEIVTSAALGTVAAPTNDGRPAVQLGAPAQIGTTLTLPHTGAVIVEEPLSVTVQDVSAVSVTVQDRDEIRVTVED